jgi:type IV secretory pathway TraG/TraD family ATPase VirD4
MKPSNPYPHTDPLALPEMVLGWLLRQTIAATLGLAAGLLAARLMRRGGLHWSWATVALAAVLLAAPDLEGAWLTAGAGALVAAVSGRRRHRQEEMDGADLAASAAARLTPADLLGSLARMAGDRVRLARGRETWMRHGRLALGRDERGRTVSVPFGGAHGGRHTLVVGATGSGKTVTQTWIATRAIEQGYGAVVVDPKGDPAMRSAIRRAAELSGAEMREWTPQGGSVYNPFGHGTDTEIADKVLAGERFTEPHYLRQAQRYLGHAVRALRLAGREVSLGELVAQLDPDSLELLGRTLASPQAELTHDYLDSLTSRQRADLAGVRDRLAILAESDVGPWLDPRTEASSFSLLEEVLAGSVVYFALEADRRPLLSQMLGAAIVQDLLSTVAALQARPVPTLVVIDEFSALAAEHVRRLFGRARSAGFSLLLGTQEISDLRLPGSAGLLEQVMGNLSLLIAHRQVVPASAELIAEVAGTRGSWRVSRRSDGTHTRTRGREGLLGRDQVMGLEPGCAAVIPLADGDPPRIARVFGPTGREGREER